MDSLRTLPPTHKFICTHILPSLRSWRMVASWPVSPRCPELTPLPSRNVFDQWFICSPSGSSSPSFWFHYHLVQVSNLKTNKTSTILHASSIYHCMFFLFLCGLLESPPFRFDTFCYPSNLPTDTTWLLSYKSTETAYPKAVNDFLTVKASRQLVLSYLTSLRYLTSLSAFLFWDPLL